MLGKTPRQLLDYKLNNNFYIYRIGTNAKRKRPLNHHFSTPLPLP